MEVSKMLRLKDLREDKDLCQKDIADFLNISTNSIYVYKARVKAKSKLSKNEFDLRVMAIEKS